MLDFKEIIYTFIIRDIKGYYYPDFYLTIANDKWDV
jgi:hypothetical protein